MKTRTAKAMSLKGKIKNIASEKKITANVVLQNFMMERFLNRLSVSEYKDKFVIKGGSLVSAMVGIDNRSTMDIDVTVKGFTLAETETKVIIKNITEINLNDDVEFEWKRCEEIRDDDVYGGLRVFLNGYFDSKSMVVPFSIDISTGDVITPEPQLQKWNCLVDQTKEFELWAYPIETILAEKIETILSRGVLSTRPRDYYDVYVLTKTHDFDKNKFSKALENTSKHRNSFEKINDVRTDFSIIENSPDLQEQWLKYANANSYTEGLSFSDVCNAVKTLLI